MFALWLGLLLHDPLGRWEARLEREAKLRYERQVQLVLVVLIGHYSRIDPSQAERGQYEARRTLGRVRAGQCVGTAGQVGEIHPHFLAKVPLMRNGCPPHYPTTLAESKEGRYSFCPLHPLQTGGVCGAEARESEQPISLSQAEEAMEVLGHWHFFSRGNLLRRSTPWVPRVTASQWNGSS